MKRVCIIQLTRIGDVIQTAQAARQLKLEHPGVQLSLIAREEAATPLNFLLSTVFDDIFCLSTLKGNRSTTLTELKDQVHSFVEMVNEDEYDFVANLSFCETSTHLTTLINSKLKLGATRNSANELVINDKWSQYIYSHVLGSAANNINLIDIYKRILGAKDNYSFGIERTEKNKIVLHPFASTRKKAWSPENWKQLVLQLREEQPSSEISIVGAKCDLPLIDQIITDKNDPMISVEVGSAQIEDTFHNLSSARLLICNDSMVSHLAAILEVPTIVLSLGEVRKAETAPYNPNAIVIASTEACYPCDIRQKCSGLECHMSIKPTLVVNLAKMTLANEKITRDSVKSKVLVFDLVNVSVNKVQFDARGLTLSKLCHSKDSSKEVLNEQFAVIYTLLLEGIELPLKIANLSHEGRITLPMLMDGIQYLHEITCHGILTCRDILEVENMKNDRKLVDTHVKKLNEISGLMQMTTSKYKLLRPMNDFFFTGRSNVQGSSFREIIENTLLLFSDEKSAYAAVLELCSSVLDANNITEHSL